MTTSLLGQFTILINNLKNVIQSCMIDPHIFVER